MVGDKGKRTVASFDQASLHGIQPLPTGKPQKPGDLLATDYKSKMAVAQAQRVPLKISHFERNQMKQTLFKEQQQQQQQQQLLNVKPSVGSQPLSGGQDQLGKSKINGKQTMVNKVPPTQQQQQQPSQQQVNVKPSGASSQIVPGKQGQLDSKQNIGQINNKNIGTPKQRMQLQPQRQQPLGNAGTVNAKVAPPKTLQVISVQSQTGNNNSNQKLPEPGQAANVGHSPNKVNDPSMQRASNPATAPRAPIPLQGIQQQGKASAAGAHSHGNVKQKRRHFLSMSR